MDELAPILDIIAIIFDLFSILVLIYGVVICAKDFLISRFVFKTKKEMITSTTLIKNQLGSYILLSLEILIAADIIETIVKPTFEDIILLAAIVIIRTVISYFLNKEIRESEEA